MTETEVRDGYGKRASEYISLFGSMDKTTLQDQRLVADWATSVRGPIIDVGCGPGHWTAYLTDLGVDAQGLDLVPAFIEQAKARFPDTVFRVGSFNDLGVLDGQVRGILAWYSLIHLQDEDLQAALANLARCLSPGGTLLLGFFDGTDGEVLAHVVTAAHFWSTDGMAARLVSAGFDVIEVQTRTEGGGPAHAAMIARRRMI